MSAMFDQFPKRGFVERQPHANHLGGSIDGWRLSALWPNAVIFPSFAVSCSERTSDWDAASWVVCNSRRTLVCGDYAAKRDSRTSSKICRKAGSGARHMVRYVSRKGSQPVQPLSFSRQNARESPQTRGFLRALRSLKIPEFEPEFPIWPKSLSRFSRKWLFCGVNKWRLARYCTEWSGWQWPPHIGRWFCIARRERQMALCIRQLAKPIFANGSVRYCFPD